MIEQLAKGNKAVGVKQTVRVVENHNARVVFIARDADEKVVRGIKESCQKNGIEIIYVESMKALGKACGIEVGAASACLMK